MIYIAKRQMHLSRELLRILLIALMSTALFGALAWLLYPWERPVQGTHERMCAREANVPLALDAIGSGPLALHSKIGSGWMARVAEHVAIVGATQRPDIAPRKLCVRVGKEHLQVDNGQKLHLQEDPQGAALHYSEAPTSFWIRPLLLSGDEVLIEVGRRLAIGEETGEYTTRIHGIFEGSADALATLFRGARCLGADRLYEMGMSGQGKKLLFFEGKRAYGLFVRAGDFLQQSGGEWRTLAQKDVALKASDASSPLARVCSISQAGLEMQGWDETGMWPLSFRIEEERGMAVPPMISLLPKKVRLGRRGLIFGEFDARRFALRKGDWLLKTPRGWRRIRRLDEVRRVLEHRLMGELFVCNGVEKIGGKYVLKGTLFNALRTMSHSASIPIEA